MSKLLKRYPNRKLYDFDIHGYVDLEDVAEFIKKDITFRVIEHSSNTDITNKTMNKALCEKIKKASLTNEQLKIMINEIV